MSIQDGPTTPTTLQKKRKAKPLDPAAEIVRGHQVPLVTGMSPATIWRRRTAEGSDFPVAIKLGDNSVGFRRSDLDAWLEKRSAKR